MGGVFSSGKDVDANHEKEPMVSQSKRKICYEHRDAYYECVKEKSAEQCRNERVEYEKRCIRSWVKYFDEMHKNQKYVNAQRQRMAVQHDLPPDHPSRAKPPN